MYEITPLLCYNRGKGFSMGGIYMMNLACLRKKWVAFVLAVLIISAYCPGVSAQQDVTSSVQMVCASMVKEGDTYFLSQGSTAHASYTLENDTDQTLTLVEIRETIGAAGHTLPLGGQSLDPGDSVTVAGTNFTAQSGGQYPIQAILVYQKDGADEILQIAYIEAATIAVSFSVSYQLLLPDVMFSGQTYTATYRASVTSHSNVSLSNVQAFHMPDAGGAVALGSPISLPPGEGGLWEKDVTAAYQHDTGGYLSIQYTDPVDGTVRTVPYTGVRVDISLTAGTPDYRLTLTGASDPAFIAEEGPVDITLTAVNEGNASLTGIVVKDWAGHMVLAAEKMVPGESKQVEIPYTVSPGDEGLFIGTATVEGTGETVAAQWNFKLPEGLRLSVERALTPRVPEMGEPFTIRYTLTNQGSRDLTDIAIDEPGLGQSVHLDALRAGATGTVGIETALMQADTSEPKITAKDRETGLAMSMTLPAMPIPVAMPDAESLLQVSLTAAHLDADSVSVACTLTNIGALDLKNCEVRLIERDIVLGSVISLPVGASETLTYEKLGTRDLTHLSARADAVLPNGDVITVMSDPASLDMGEPAGPAEETPPQQQVEPRGNSILVPIMIAVIVLGVVALAVIFWPAKKKKGAHARPQDDAEGGGRE